MRFSSGFWAGRVGLVAVLAICGSSVFLAGEASGQEMPAEQTEPRVQDSAKPASEPTWMDRVDGFFGTYLVRPLATVLFFDFGTHRFQMARLSRYDQDGDGLISGQEAQGRLLDHFGDVDQDGDGYLRPDEYKVLAPSVPFVVAWLFMGGLFFTLRMSFINVRAFWHAIRLTRGDYDNPAETGEVSHFQALSSAPSATVGLGNIAGVAIAVGSGGPGAIFWLILAGLLGMTSKFAECTLGQIYRKVAPDGTVSGGPMHYLRDGLRDLGWGRLGGVLAGVYAVVCMGASFGGGCAFQVGQSLGSVKEQFPFLDRFPWIYGLLMALMVGVVIIGGIQRIAATASRIVPLMCGMYVLMALAVLAIDHERILPTFGLIFRQAFTDNAVYGGFLGVAVMGIRARCSPTRRGWDPRRSLMRRRRRRSRSARGSWRLGAVHRYRGDLYDDRVGDCDYGGLRSASVSRMCFLGGGQRRSGARRRGPWRASRGGSPLCSVSWWSCSRTRP